MASKYNYEAAVELIANMYPDNTKVSYTKLEEALGLEEPLGTISSANASAISILRSRLKTEYKLDIRSNRTKKRDEEGVYVIFELKNTLSQLKASNSEQKVTKEWSKNEYFDALSKNNQKLYAESEKLKLETERLKTENEKLRKKEEEYRKIINSFYMLSML